MTSMATTAPTKPWTGPPRSRRAISTTARSRSTAAPTRSSATSSPRRCWGCEVAIRLVVMAGVDPAIHVLTQGKNVDARDKPGHDEELRWPERASKMDFELSEEQRLLKESVDGLLTDSYDFDARKKYQKEKDGWSTDVWGKLAEQGLLGLPFAEADGGFGAGAVETRIVMEALGKAMVLEPYL